MTSLYVHIPFCLKRCIYCDFVSGIYEPEKEIAYLAAVKKEIIDIGDKPLFNTLYIGGGTPTALSTNALSDLVTHIFKHIPLVESYEATIEANPWTLDMEKLRAIHSSGINRVSIGVQSFNDNELNFLGRLHSSKDAEQAVYLARDAGFENIGIDLIYGVPGQDMNSWKKTLEKTVNLKPKHISTYELTAEKGTVLYEYLKNNVKPDEDRIIEMYEYAIDYLSSKGFIHYEISNFAMSGYFCRHNLNYWNRGEYLGVGLGAHSFTLSTPAVEYGRRFYNIDNLEDYMKAINEGMSPVKGSEDITEDNALSEAIFLGLRKTEGINLKAFYESYRKDILTHYQKEIKELREAGLIILDRNHLKLTGKGLLLSNEVFRRFMH